MIKQWQELLWYVGSAILEFDAMEEVKDLMMVAMATHWAMTILLLLFDKPKGSTCLETIANVPINKHK